MNSLIIRVIISLSHVDNEQLKFLVNTGLVKETSINVSKKKKEEKHYSKPSINNDSL